MAAAPTTTSSPSTACPIPSPTAPRCAWRSRRRKHPSANSRYRHRCTMPPSAIPRARWSTSAPRAAPTIFTARAWWWIRNKKFDTPTIFQNRSGQSLPQYTDNRYGVSGGGPVFIPKVYNGKNKTFWQIHLGSQQIRRSQRGRHHLHRTARRLENRRSLRSAETRRGLPGLRSRHHRRRPQRTLQPHALRRQHHSGQPHRSHRQEHPRRSIPCPTRRAPPTAATTISLRAAPTENYWTTIGRFDHAFSEKDRMFIRGNRDFWLEDKNHNFLYDPTSKNVNGIYLNRINRAIALDEVHMFSASLVLQFRYGVHCTGIPRTARQPGLRYHLAGLLAGLRGAVPERQGGHPATSASARSARSAVRNRATARPPPSATQ